jgi:hypothetical protein
MKEKYENTAIIISEQGFLDRSMIRLSLTWVHFFKCENEEKKTT